MSSGPMTTPSRTLPSLLAEIACSARDALETGRELLNNEDAGPME